MNRLLEVFAERVPGLRARHWRKADEHAAHGQAQRFWRNSTHTFRAGDAYYARAERCIEENVLPLIEPHHRVLDVGCGDGRFSLLLASRCRELVGYDLSPQLIEQARSTASERGMTNARFEVGDAATSETGRRYDLVSCMGVLACLIDDDAFTRTLAYVADSVGAGGRLLLRETVSGRGRVVWARKGYVACYRPMETFVEQLTAGGLRLSQDVQLAAWSRKARRTNHLLLFEKRA